MNFRVNVEVNKETIAPYSSQSDLKLRPLPTLMVSFSNIRGCLHAFILSFHWHLLTFSFPLFETCDYNGL